MNEKINKMVEENIKLVPYIVHTKFKVDINKKPDLLDEYIGVGNEALIEACQKFDESRGLAFSTYAFRIIWGGIQRFKRDKVNSIRLPRRLHKAGTEYSRGKALNKDLDTICEESGVKKEDIEEWLANKDIVNLDTPVRDHKDEGSTTAMLDMIADDFDVEDSVVDDIKYKEKMDILEKILKPQEFKIVKLVESGVYKQKDISEKIGLSQPNVSRVLRKLTQKVGPALDEYYRGEITLQEFCNKLNIKEEVFMSFNKEIDVVCKWLIDNPGEELNLGKVLKDAGMDNSSYIRAKIRNKAYKRMKDKGYNIQEIPYGAKGTRLVLYDSGQVENTQSKPILEIEPVNIDTVKDNVLLNILDIPVETCNLEFTEALQRSLSMFTMLGKTAVLDIRVREVS